MAVTIDWLNTTILLTDSAATIYANPASTTTFITSITLHNTHSAAITVNLYRVPDNASAVGTAADGNQFLEYSLAANETLVLNDNTIILGDTNDTIQGVASTTNKVTIFIDGVKKT